MAAPLALSPALRAEVIERIPAVVDGRPLMLSEVRLVERLRGLDRSAAVEALIDERLMYREAARLPQAAVTAQDEERAYLDLAAKLSEAEVRVAEADLRRLVRRQAAILKYVEFRFRPQVRIEEEALRRAYEAEFGAREDAPAFTAVASELRERLAERELGEKIEAWIKELRATAEIRHNPASEPASAW